MRTERVQPRFDDAEIGGGRRQAFGHCGEGWSYLADVKRGIEVAAQHLQVAVGIGVRPRHLGQQKELRLAQIRGELLDGPAKVTSRLLIHVFQRVDPEPIAVGQCDPVLVAAADIVERGRAVVVDVSVTDEVGPAELGVGVIDAASAQISLPRPGVVLIGLQFRRPDAVVVASPGGDQVVAPNAFM